MKLTIANGSLYTENLFFSFVSIADGKDLRPGKHGLEVRYSHHHGKDLVFAEGIGWVGSSEGVDVVLGRVRGNNAVIPSPVLESRLIGMVERVQDAGEKVTLTVERNG